MYTFEAVWLRIQNKMKLVPPIRVFLKSLKMLYILNQPGKRTVKSKGRTLCHQKNVELLQRLMTVFKHGNGVHVLFLSIDERQSQGPGGASRFEIKEEQGPASGSTQPNRKDSIATGDGDRSSHNVGDLGYGQVGGEAGSQRSFPHPLRHQRPMRECSSALGGLNGQKQLARTPGAGRGDSASSGAAEDSAGPSAPDTAVVEPPGDRPHHCLECGKTFRLISSLKKHIRIHTGEKPYPCGVCGRRFRESGALKTHLRIHTGEKPYSCSECGNCFRHLDGLRKHRRTHTGEKPYVCAICGKRLSRLQHLKHHQLIHTGERPCCCPFCNRTFKEPAALRKHIRTHPASSCVSEVK
uniref:Si:ch1073-224n8.1 n=1 Tax=Neolamprologus brichardi TaxID=32507 RepID=A0A3Q4N5Y3_NEOBR